MIFLHGIGERGANSTDPSILETTINTVAKIGPPAYAKAGTPFPFILISPQLKQNYSTWPSSYVLEVINHVKTYLRIDERRIHITGLSLGGGGAWVTAQDYPKLFASASPVCGGYNSTSKACAIAAENLPVWAFHGDKDTIVPLSKSANMVNAINACAATPIAKLDVYAGVAHDAWVRAYSPDHRYHSPNVYEWINSHINTHTSGNAIPVADAGADKNITAGTASVTITGTATDKENAITSYQWTKVSGPAATVAGTNSSTLTISGPSTGTYVFRFQVSDNAGNTDSDYVKLTVSANNAPVANAGPDMIITLPVNTVSIQGSGTAANGAISAYSWTKISGGNASLSGENTSTLNASSLVGGTYVFRLKVTNDQGASHVDDVKVTVNTPPAVHAGVDYTITLPKNSTVIAGSSSDSDGTIVSYTWQKLLGPTVTMTGANTPAVSVAGLTEGSFIFRFTVKDNAGAIRFDDVKITVIASSSSSIVANVPPTARAGADKIIHLPTTSVSIAGSASDSDGTIASYMWLKLSGNSVTLSNTTTPTLTVSNMTAGTYLFRLTVKDNAGAIHLDDVKVTVNNPPTVYAGADVKVLLPNNKVTVSSSASDLDGTISSYQWKMMTGPGATLGNTDTPSLSVSQLVAGSYVFRVTVTDNLGATKSDDVGVSVQNATAATAFAEADLVELDKASFDLTKDESFWSDKLVIVFDSSGKALFQGRWQPERYNDVFHSGLYIVTIYDGAKQINNQKIYKRN